MNAEEIITNQGINQTIIMSKLKSKIELNVELDEIKFRSSFDR